MKRFLSVIFCVLFLFTSCTHEKNIGFGENDTDNLTESANDNVLTNVFRGTEFVLPAGFDLYGRVLPYYDGENDVVTMFGRTDRGAALLSLDTDGTILDLQILGGGADTIVGSGVITANAVYVICYSYDADTMIQSYFVMRYDRAKDSRSYSDSFNDIFTDEYGIYLTQLAVDGDGYLYISCGHELAVLDSNMRHSFTLKSDVYINKLTSADTVYVGGSVDTMTVDFDGKCLVDVDELPQKVDIPQFCAGSGYDLYYTADDGLHGFNFASGAENEIEDVLLFDWQNSDLFADNVNVTNVVNPDRVIMFNENSTSLIVYDRTEDIDLSNITVLEIAYAYRADSKLSSHIVKFNDENPNIRLITRDYSVYVTDSDPHAGADKLINDMLNGIYTPDIVVGSSVYESVFTEIIENGLYTDLYTFTENDSDVMRDDIFGCIRRMCETKDGELAMLPANFSVIMTLAAPKSLVGEKTSWTLTEMLDFIEALPDDVLIMRGLTKNNASFALLGNTGYGMFVDTENGTCDFESEEFLRYLRVLESFPDTSSASNEEYDVGDIALSAHYFYNDIVGGWMNMYTLFGTDEVVPIGYASSSAGVGNAITSFMPYVITSNCEHKEEAWRFLKSTITSSGTDGKTYPILKSQLTKYLANEYGTYYEIYTDGAIRKFPKNVTYDATGDTQRPGFRMLFDESEGEKIIDWLDNNIGTHACETISDEIADIIDEEISAYLGGVRTAEECAGIIQSRVGIWLSEHE